MKKIILVSFLIAITLLCPVVIVHAFGAKEDIVTLTANTNQSQYAVYSQVTFNESMAYFSNPATTYPSDGLVGVQLENPFGGTLFTRTLQTGSTTPFNLTATVTNAYVTNSNGEEVSSISLPPYYYGAPSVYFDITNNWQTSQNLLVVISIFDSNGIPIFEGSQQATVGGVSSSENSVSLSSIQSTAHYGTAYAYVDVFNTWPSQGGYPISEEYAFTFMITGGTAFQGTPPTTYTVNNGPTHYFNMTFRMPKDPSNLLDPANGVTGTYTIYSSTNYEGTTGNQTTTFQYLLLGDLNGDGVINFNDITTFVTLYIAYYQDHTYSASIDFNHDGLINFEDVTLFVTYYLQYWGS